ncbi:related to Probable tripeptidyl-peptidase SED2 [Rhynchosporium agropyri]|uniref:tripeptidyl-peptidase II n=1 Tax=Rhynchosporium agropyri TaxID=914238 RepID=A0A1E1KGC4_9HELO|nr:related to Probable tripeptidyl-peptidase SED2 [Rhynchosporium agropyri]
MFFTRYILPSAVLIFCVSALPSPTSRQDTYGSYQVIENKTEVPSGWMYQGPANSNTILPLRLIVKSPEGDRLSNKLLEISTPGHEDYGNYLSQHELRSLVASESGSVDLLTSWLKSYSGVSDVVYSAHASSLSLKTTVSGANSMFATEFGVFEAANGEGTVVRSLGYGLPESLTQHIALVHPVTHFPTVQSPKSSSLEEAIKESEKAVASFSKRDIDPALLAACESITPTCIAKMYNIDYTPPVNCTTSGSSLGVAGFLDEYINHKDVTDFVRKYGNSAATRANPGTFTVELVNGGINNESYPGVEATLDMQYSMPFIGSLPVVYYSTGGRSPALGPDGKILPISSTATEPYLEWLEYMLAKPDGAIPQVIVISYTDTEQVVPRDYAVHVCDLFGRLAARGVSIINASGDGGLAGQRDGACVSNDGLNTPKFLPTFPASCPWVTSVGATTIIPEQAASFSSGGFSNYFAAPSYQLNATGAYKTFLNGKYDGLYNASGRGIPDISLYGSRYQTENGGFSSGWHSGTSAGTPVIASMIALVNDIRLRNGKPVLGWLNPMLYSEKMKSVWNDITEGISYGCDETWETTTGWDTVTGLGSPDFKRLVAALQ